MKRQHKLIFAILFGFNVLLTVVGIVIGASFPTIALSISTAVWIAIHYHQLKDYAELMSTYLSVRDTLNRDSFSKSETFVLTTFKIGINGWLLKIEHVHELQHAIRLAGIEKEIEV